MRMWLYENSSSTFPSPVENEIFPKACTGNWNGVSRALGGNFVGRDLSLLRQYLVQLEWFFQYCKVTLRQKLRSCLKFRRTQNRTLNFLIRIESNTMIVHVCAELAITRSDAWEFSEFPKIFIFYLRYIRS